VVFVNDSASINVESTWRSLTMCEGSVILLIGGIDSRNDYAILEDLVSKKVRLLIGLGTDNTKLLRSFLKTGVEIRSAASIQEAVEQASGTAKPGELVLFSPACPSYHPFDNYKNRGNDFKRAVQTLTEKNNP
jgi:UDP-N-acetylmuramoylalanine--D-glutamate ligase